MSWWQGVSQCWPLGPACHINWTAWGTVSSLFVGAATVGIGVLAWRTSRGASEIAARAADIANQQHLEGVALRHDNAAILGRLLLAEVTLLPVRIHRIARAWKAAVDWNGDMRISNQSAFLFALKESKRPLLPSSEQVQEQIHNLPLPLGPDLATVIGELRDLRKVASDTAEKVRDAAAGPSSNAGRTLLYAGSFSDFMALRRQLENLINLAPVLTRDFQEFAQVPAVNYEAKGAHSSPWD